MTLFFLFFCVPSLSSAPLRLLVFASITLRVSPVVIELGANFQKDYPLEQGTRDTDNVKYTLCSVYEMSECFAYCSE